MVDTPFEMRSSEAESFPRPDTRLAFTPDLEEKA